MHFKIMLLSYVVACQVLCKWINAQSYGTEEDIDASFLPEAASEGFENEEVEEFVADKSAYSQPAPFMMPLMMPSAPTAAPLPPPPPNIIMMPAPPPAPPMHFLKRRRHPTIRPIHRKPIKHRHSTKPLPTPPQPVALSTSILTVTASAYMKPSTLPLALDVEEKFTNGIYLPSFMNGTVLSGVNYPALSLNAPIKTLQYDLLQQQLGQSPSESMLQLARSLMRLISPIRPRLSARQASVLERKALWLAAQKKNLIKRQQCFDHQKMLLFSNQGCQQENLLLRSGCCNILNTNNKNGTMSQATSPFPNPFRSGENRSKSYSISVPSLSPLAQTPLATPSLGSLSNSPGVNISNFEFDGTQGQNLSDEFIIKGASAELQDAAEMLLGPLQNFLNVLTGLSNMTAKEVYGPFLSESQFFDVEAQVEEEKEVCSGPVFVPLAVPTGFDGLQNSLLFKPKHNNRTDVTFGIPLNMFPNGAVVLPLNKTAATLECALVKSIVASSNALLNATINDNYIMLPFEASRLFEAISTPATDLTRNGTAFNAVTFNATTDLSSCVSELASLAPESKNLKSDMSPPLPDQCPRELDTCRDHRSISEYLATLSL